MHRRVDQFHDKIVKAHERRWGQSTLPIRVVPARDNDNAAWSFDDESGAACKWDLSAWRIRCIDEKEPSF